MNLSYRIIQNKPEHLEQTSARIAFMVCRACRHPNRDEIDRQLIAGTPLRVIVASSGLSLGGLVRHKQCIKETLGVALRERSQEETAAHGSNLLQRVQKLADEAIGILAAAKAEKNLKAATSAICAAVRTLELIGRLDGSLAQPHAPGLHLTLNKTTINVTNYDDDLDFARMVGEATKGFNLNEFERLRALAQGKQDGHNSAIAIPQSIDAQ